MKKNKPYHLFKFRNNNYMFHVESCAAIRVDDSAFDALSFLLHGNDKKNLSNFLMNFYCDDTVRSVVNDIDMLDENGFFIESLNRRNLFEEKKFIYEYINYPITNIELFLSESCNFRCVYCFVGENNALNRGLMRWETAKKAIDFLFEKSMGASHVNIVFFGGEPLLNIDVLYSAVTYSQELSVRFNKSVTYGLTTNATVVSDEIISFFKRYNFSIMVSLDGPKDIHDQQRFFSNGKVTFDHVYKNIEKLKESFSSLFVYATNTRKFLDERLRIVNFLENMEFFNIGIAHCLGRMDKDYSYNFKAEDLRTMRMRDELFLDHIIENIRQKKPVRFNPWSSGILSLHYPKKSRLSCAIGTNSLSVGADGLIYPCDHYIGMKNYVIGDIQSGVDKEKLAKLLENYFKTKKKCRYCWAVKLCGGYCPARLSKENGSFGLPKDWWCEDVLKWFEQAIWLYDTLKTQYPDYLIQLVGEKE